MINEDTVQIATRIAQRLRDAGVAAEIVNPVPTETAVLWVWAAFSVLAALVQWALERAALLDFTMATASNVLGGLLLVAAGSYQWTRLKDVCLTQCQKPFAFLMRQGGFRGDVPGALMLGLRHGAYCVGCCWALVALLLVGGVTNVLWIVLLALFILLEKVTSFGRQIALVAGMVLIVGGVWLFSWECFDSHARGTRLKMM